MKSRIRPRDGTRRYPGHPTSGVGGGVGCGGGGKKGYVWEGKI